MRLLGGLGREPLVPARPAIVPIRELGKSSQVNPWQEQHNCLAGSVSRTDGLLILALCFKMWLEGLHQGSDAVLHGQPLAKRLPDPLAFKKQADWDLHGVALRLLAAEPVGDGDPALDHGLS